MLTIKKIVDRRHFSDYLIETTHPTIGYVCKVVSVRGLSEKDAITHLENRFSKNNEGSDEKIAAGFSKDGIHFPGNNDYWGWSNTISAWFTDADVVSKRQFYY